jgi:flagellar motor switch protein FliM
MAIRDLLTPEELDALLHEVDGGRLASERSPFEAAGDAVTYDFSAQEHLVRSSMPTLEMIYEKFARQLRTTLSGVLRRGATADLTRVEILRCADWTAALPKRCGMHLAKVRPLQGIGIFVLPPHLVYLFVDSYFGGRADAENLDERIEQHREITQSELRITRLVIDRIAKDLEAAWAPFFKIALEHAGVETNPLFASIASPLERVIAAHFTVQLGEFRGELSFVIPSSMVEPIRALLDNALFNGHPETDRRWRDKLVENLLCVDLELRGTLVETVVPLRRILTLRPGDVIPIDIPRQLPVDLEGTTLFRGALGAAKGRNALKITQVLLKAGDGESVPGAGLESGTGVALPEGGASTAQSANRSKTGFAACA